MRRDHHPLAAIVERYHRQQVLAGLGVPKKRAAIIARGSNQSIIRTEIDRLDTGSVARERSEFVASCNIPDLDRVVRTTCRQQFAVATETDFAHRAAVSFDRPDHPAGRDVPKLDLAHCFDLHIAQNVRVIRLLRSLFWLLILRATHHARDVDVHLRLDSSGCQQFTITCEGERCDCLAHRSGRHRSERARDYRGDVGHVWHGGHLTGFDRRQLC